MKNRNLYDAITDFATEYGSRKFNDANNMSAYNELVDKCIRAKKIPECNRYEYSTHNRLLAAITYYDNRLRFCEEESK